MAANLRLMPHNEGKACYVATMKERVGTVIMKGLLSGTVGLFHFTFVWTVRLY